MDTDSFADLLLRNISDCDRPANRRNVTLDLIASERQPDDFIWWTVRGRILATDHDLEGLHLTMENRLSHRAN